MALRTDLPKIPVDREPTIWNRNMGAWAFCASLLSVLVVPPLAIAFGTASLVPSIVSYGMIAIGGFIGGQRQKAEMEKEAIHGKIVREPTFWNSKVLSNYMAVSIPVGLAITAAAYSLGIDISSLADQGVQSIGAEKVTQAMGLVTAAGIGGLVAIVSGIFGGFDQKEQMQKEFDQAVDIKMQQDVSRGLQQMMSRAPQRGISQAQSPYVNSVSQAESAMLEQKMRSSSQPRSFSQEMQVRREAMAAVPPEKLV